MFHGHAVCWVLGETLEAARRGALAVRVELRGAAVARDGARGDRGRQLPGRAAPGGARGRRGGARGVRPRLQRRDRVLRPGALLPRDALLAGPGRRERAGLRPEQHPAPVRDAGDRRPRPRAAKPPRDRPVPADGRRLRRQGDAAARVRGGRRARRGAHGTAGAGPAQPHPGHDDVRQAARLPRAVAGRLRRRRPAPGAGRDLDLRRRLEPRPVRARPGAGPLPRRQRLLDPRRAPERPDREDQQDVADGLPRVRRPAGDARPRGHPRPLRAAARPRRRRPAPP